MATGYVRRLILTSISLSILLLAYLYTFPMHSTLSPAYAAREDQKVLDEKKDIAIDHVPGRLIVKFKTGISEDEREEVLARNNARTIEEIEKLNIKIVAVPETILELVESNLQENHAIEYVEKDFLLKPQEMPNDPWASNAWHLQITNTFKAFDLSKGDGVTIAILDSGVEANHPDLTSKLVSGYNFYENSNNWSDPCGHGTAVAGMAAAATGNGIGVVGAAWNSKIMPLKITDSNCYGSYSAMGKAILHAADSGAKVANISFLIYNGYYIKDAAKYMYNKGGLIVAAGGNTGIFENYQDNPHIISVSATDGADLIVYYSSYGPYIDFAAPGDGAPTTYLNNQYGYLGGTSAAAPVVSGILALMYAVNPAAAPAEIYDALKQSAVDRGEPGYDYYYGWGRVDALGAVQIIKGKSDTTATVDDIPPVVSAPPSQLVEAAGASGSIVSYPPPTASDNTGVTSGPICDHASNSLFPLGATTVTCTALDTAGNVGIASFIITVQDTTPPNLTVPSELIVISTSLYGTEVNYSASAIDAVDGSVNVICSPSSGSVFQIGTTTVACTASDLQGNTDTKVFTVTVALQDSTINYDGSPTVSFVNPTNGAVIKGTVIVSVSVSNFNVQKVELYINSVLKKTLTTEPFEYSWNTKSVKVGSYTLTAVAYDHDGNVSKGSVTVTVVKK